MKEVQLHVARAELMRLFPFFAEALFAIRFVEEPGLGTFAVDDGWKLYWDPELPWTQRFVRTALLHEMLHLVRAHAIRRDAVMKERGKLEPATWNIAADCEINAFIKTLAETTKQYGNVFGFPKTHGVYPKTFGLSAGKTAEFYYGELRAQDLANEERAQHGQAAEYAGTQSQQQDRDERAKRASGIDQPKPDVKPDQPKPQPGAGEPEPGDDAAQPQPGGEGGGEGDEAAQGGDSGQDGGQGGSGAGGQDEADTARHSGSGGDEGESAPTGSRASGGSGSGSGSGQGQPEPEPAKPPTYRNWREGTRKFPKHIVDCGSAADGVKRPWERSAPDDVTPEQADRILDRVRTEAENHLPQGVVGDFLGIDFPAKAEKLWVDAITREVQHFLALRGRGFVRPSRRYQMPDLVVAGKGKSFPRIVFLVDVSGSIGKEAAAKAYAVIKAFDGWQIDFRIVAFGTKAVEIPLADIRNGTARYDGGGTRVGPALEIIRRNHVDAELVIAITDGLVNDVPRTDWQPRVRCPMVVFTWNTAGPKWARTVKMPRLDGSDLKAGKTKQAV